MKLKKKPLLFLLVLLLIMGIFRFVGVCPLELELEMSAVTLAELGRLFRKD